MQAQKKGLSLRTRLTLSIGAVILFSIFLSWGIVALLDRIFPFLTHIPTLLQINLFSFTIATIATRIISKLFFDPIQDLREGMRKVADGDFQVRLDTTSSSKEIREVMAGFNMMAQELNATEILQSDFVSNVSHEFKTPINAIEGYTTLLQSDELNEEQREYAEKILFNTKRLSTLVGNILLLSRIENQSIQTQKSTFRADEQIRQSILGLEAAWTEKELEFDVEMEEILFTGNEALLRHVWDNIIGNAVKFSPHGGIVAIRLKQEETCLRFTVEDSGPGLSKEAQKHLFDKFYQGDTSHKQEGNGLGLALVKRILTLAKGSVSAENLTGGGCRFTVTLPLFQQ
ncbi:MAG: HAMP domain-containing histidine kinase [Clostridia bacterium]|nr:HAMP domain-containing histidine kinase [Clostridia bacterium]MBQ4323302.1 HAMP domain-containing histidine kinase [Clostridia bacterium]